MARLIWRRADSYSKDLYLVNPRDFDKAEYLRILGKFVGITGDKLGDRLGQNLRGFGASPGDAALTFRCDRLGYDGLNRWCTTEGTRFTDDEVFAAQRVWKFLFGQSHPPTLVKPAGKTGLDVSEGTWNRWYEAISRTEG